MGTGLIATVSSIGGVIVLAALITAGMVGCPQYKVWEQGLAGKAKLERATQERKIIVEQAKAELESAEIRAQAIEVLGQKAKDFPEYRLQEFMGAFAEALQNDNIDKIIYVPTEANIPVMEAGKR